MITIVVIEFRISNICSKESLWNLRSRNLLVQKKWRWPYLANLAKQKNPNLEGKTVTVFDFLAGFLLVFEKVGGPIKYKKLSLM